VTVPALEPELEPELVLALEPEPEPGRVPRCDSQSGLLPPP